MSDPHPEVTIMALRDTLAEAQAESEYLRWRLTEIMPLFEEARDALPAISLASARLRGIRLDLAERMDRAGTRTRPDFDRLRESEGERK